MNHTEAKVLLLFLCMALCQISALADDTGQLDRAVKAVVAALPPRWALVEERTNEIPYGHHWGENYVGPKGILIIAKGIRPVNAEFANTNGTWRAVHVATEALEIWIMPSNYSNSFWSWLSISRPIQPVVVVGQGPVKVYASQWAVLLSKKDFNEILKKSAAVRWPDPQVDSSKFLAWKDWRSRLREAIEKEFAK